MTDSTAHTHEELDSSKDTIQSLRKYPEVSLDEALSTKGLNFKITGAVGVGKTEFLIRKTAQFLEEGAAAQEICVVVNTPDAQKAFKERLSAFIGKPSEVTVTTILQLCRKILSTPEALAATGRMPRILNDAEYKFILEDMKTVGLQPGRIKKMLNYFYYQWSQLEPEEEWLLPREEHGVREELDKHLRFRNAMLREELSPLCVGYLKGLSDVGGLGFEHVLVDDYQNLGKASQVVCQILGKYSITVAGNENQLIEGFDPYPFNDGFAYFEDYRDKTSCLQLNQNTHTPPALVEMGNALCRQGDMSPERRALSEGALDKAVIDQIKWSVPEEEFAGLSRVVRDVFEKDSELTGQDVYLVVPNKYWAKTFGRSLAAKGYDSTVVLDSQALSGDPRDFDRAGMLIAYTKLNLAADPHDVVAWRSWCGFGDYLCYSGAWTRLEKWAEEQDKDILESLAFLADSESSPFLESEVLKERYQSGLETIDALANKTGFALAKALTGPKGSKEFGDLVEPIQGDEDCRELYLRVRDRILEPSFEDTTRKIRIGSYKRLQGLNPKVIVVSGLIDGFMPSRNCFDVALLEEERNKECAIFRRIYYNALGKCGKHLVLSTIQKASLEMAETMKMEVRRVKMERGERLAMLSPSVFIEEAGDTVPGSQSGQQYLSEI